MWVILGGLANQSRKCRPWRRPRSRRVGLLDLDEGPTCDGEILRPREPIRTGLGADKAAPAFLFLFGVFQGPSLLKREGEKMSARIVARNKHQNSTTAVRVQLCLGEMRKGSLRRVWDRMETGSG
jgi:hypothetical protein